MDSIRNKEHFGLILDAIQDSFLARARDPLPLLIIVTECPERERAAKERIMLERVEKMLDRHPERVQVKVVACDLAGMAGEELARLRDSFWQHLFAGAGSEPQEEEASFLANLESEMSNWPEGSKFGPWLAESVAWLHEMRQMADRLRPGGSYMGGRQMSYFRGLHGEELRKRGLRHWQRATGIYKSADAILRLQPPTLPEGHPLEKWQEAYWLRRLRAQRDAISAFVRRVEWMFANSFHPEVSDLETWFEEQAGSYYDDALAAFPESFELLCNLAAKFPDEMSEGHGLCTLLALSQLEARYSENSRRISGSA